MITLDTPTMHSCCYRTALDLDAGYCFECGSPLLRCAAFEECGGLLDGGGACSVCVAPTLSLDAGGAEVAKVGGGVALALTVGNASTVGRPLFLKGLWIREAGGSWKAIAPSWNHIDAGASAPLTVNAVALERAGVHQIEIAFAFATRWKWREEVFAFTAGLSLSVEQETATTVQQNIHYAADAPQTGATIYAPLRVESNHESTRSTTREAQALPLTRADALERTLRLRGDENNPAVQRGARLRWRGFDPGTTPQDGPIVTRDGLYAIGRGRAKPTGGSNDVRLLAIRPDGGIDEIASRAISRQHFDLYVENDRLMLRVESERGGYVNGKRIPRGVAIALHDGDQFSPIPHGERSLVVEIRFEDHHGSVETITLARRPASLRVDPRT